MATPSSDDLLELDAAALAEWLARPDLPSETAVLLLRNPRIERSQIEALLERREFHKLYDFRLEIARHPRSPATAALGALRTLYWRDQFEISRDVRANPYIRQNAVMVMQQRIPEMRLGERVTLARIAGSELIPALMGLREAQVLEALLDNPRLQEGHVVLWLEESSTPGAVVQRIARHHRWGNAHRVRHLLIRDPRLTDQAAMRMMKGLPESELRRIAEGGGGNRLRAAAAQRLLERKR